MKRPIDTDSQVITVRNLLKMDIKVLDELQDEEISYNSGLLERMMLNLDIWNRGICTIYCVENLKDDTIEIIDKKSLEILETLVNFIELESFPLTKLGVMKECEGLRFSQLEPRFKRRIESCCLHVLMVKNYGDFTKEDLLFLSKTFS